MTKFYFYSSLLFIILVAHAGPLLAQPMARLTVAVREGGTGGAVIGAAVVLDNTTPLNGSATDTNGRARLTAAPGTYNVKVSSVGYKPQVRYNVVLTTGNTQTIVVELEQDANQQADIEILIDRRRTATAAKIETPLSTQRLTTEEIKSNPGGNFDISRVIQALPGVAGSTGGSAGVRNDIIIRGGAPNENVYYLDGIEVPVINHFQTSGSSGGPAGIINVSFIEDLTLSSSSFHSRYDNTLASVLQFRQKEGNADKIQGSLRAGTVDAVLTLEGPISKKTTFIASGRRSYYQFLFSALDSPIRPSFWDYQFKVTHKLSEKTTLSVLGIGAIDDFKFVVPKKSTPEGEVQIRSLPYQQLYTYTVGAVLRHQLDQGFWQLALSRNTYDVHVDRYEEGNRADPAARTLDLAANETESKARFEINKTIGGFKLSGGVLGQVAEFRNKVFIVVAKQLTDSAGQVLQPGFTTQGQTDIAFLRYGAFAQVSREFFNGKLGLSAGVRTDGNTFTDRGNDLAEALSPRVAASFGLSDVLRLNASIGRYAKLPIYNVLGYRDNEGRLANKDNRYLISDHYTAGIEYLPSQTTRLTVEGFFKDYKRYYYSLRNGLSLANLGGGFDAIGNERTISKGRGQTYGGEVFFQQKLIKNIFATVSYTYVVSKYSGLDGRLIPSAWDTRHLFSAILGRKFKRGWEMGLKLRYAGGTPFTPYDAAASRLNYLSQGAGTLDFTRTNSERLKPFTQFDFRLDKKVNLRGFTVDVYFDVQNAFVLSNPQVPEYTFQRTEDGKSYITTDSKPIRPDGSNGVPILLSSSSTFVIPSIGLILEF